MKRTMVLSKVELQTVKNARSEIQNWPFIRGTQLAVGIGMLVVWFLDSVGFDVWLYSSLDANWKILTMSSSGVLLGSSFNERGARKARLLVKLASKAEQGAT